MSQVKQVHHMRAGYYKSPLTPGVAVCRLNTDVQRLKD